jgi:hypothetical protein
MLGLLTQGDTPGNLWRRIVDLGSGFWLEENRPLAPQRPP